MNTKTKGSITELKVLTKLMERGYTVSLPFGENAPYDFIFDDGEKLNRVQCKTAHADKSRLNSICFKLKSVYYQASVGKVAQKSAQKHRIDYYGVYFPQEDSTYLIPSGELPTSEASLRLGEPNRNERKVRWAEDFRI